jgi:hypothetical protein
MGIDADEAESAMRNRLTGPAPEGTGEYPSSALLSAPAALGRGRQSPDPDPGHGRGTGRLELG